MRCLYRVYALLTAMAIVSHAICGHQRGVLRPMRAYDWRCEYTSLLACPALHVYVSSACGLDSSLQWPPLPYASVDTW